MDWSKWTEWIKKNFSIKKKKKEEIVWGAPPKEEPKPPPEKKKKKVTLVSNTNPIRIPYLLPFKRVIAFILFVSNIFALLGGAPITLIFYAIPSCWIYLDYIFKTRSKRQVWEGFMEE